MQFVAETVDVLGGPEVFKKSIRTPSELDRAVAEGLPTESLSSTISLIAAPASNPASASIDRLVPPTTWKRRVKAGRLSPDESDRTVRLAHVVAVARYVLGDDDIVRRFFQMSHLELEGRKPADVALSDVGSRQVEDILWRIFYGLPV